MKRWDDEEQLMTTECVLCNGPLTSLGRLGVLEHFRCRNCGHEQSEPVTSDETPETESSQWPEGECPKCHGPVGPAGAGLMTDRRCDDPSHESP